MYGKNRNPGAFMSYAHIDDDDGRLSEFREKLSAQTRKLIGESFPIFQDCEDIKWGQEWEARIDESLAEVTFFIPIITPSFFRSKYCRDELARFLEREERLGLKLILPVYYIETHLIENGSARSADELAQNISSRQYADCRDILIEDLDSLKIRKLMLKMSTQIRDVLQGISTETSEPPVIASTGSKTDQLPINPVRTTPGDIVFEADEVKSLKVITELYYVNKKLMLYAEQLNQQDTFIPPINEIRYAFDHLMGIFGVRFELIAEYDNYVSTNLNKAFSHIYRATFDLLEYILIYQQELISTKLDGISTETLVHVFPDYYQQIVPDIEKLFGIILDIRERKDIGNPNLEDINEHVKSIEKIKSYISYIDRRLPALIEFEKEKRKNKKISSLFRLER